MAWHYYSIWEAKIDGAFVGNTEASFTYWIPHLAFSFAMVQGGVLTRKGISGNCGTGFCCTPEIKIKNQKICSLTICLCSRSPNYYDLNVFIPGSPAYHIYMTETSSPCLRGPRLLVIVTSHSAFPWVFPDRVSRALSEPLQNLYDWRW